MWSKFVDETLLGDLLRVAKLIERKVVFLPIPCLDIYGDWDHFYNDQFREFITCWGKIRHFDEILYIMRSLRRHHRELLPYEPTLIFIAIYSTTVFRVKAITAYYCMSPSLFIKIVKRGSKGRAVLPEKVSWIPQSCAILDIASTTWTGNDIVWGGSGNMNFTDIAPENAQRFQFLMPKKYTPMKALDFLSKNIKRIRSQLH